MNSFGGDAFDGSKNCWVKLYDDNDVGESGVGVFK
jgi:hypothetical protein